MRWRWGLLGVGAVVLVVGILLANLTFLGARHLKFGQVAGLVLVSSHTPDSLSSDQWLRQIKSSSVPSCFSENQADRAIDLALEGQQCVPLVIASSSSSEICDPLISSVRVTGLRMFGSQRTEASYLLGGSDAQALAAYSALQDTKNWLPTQQWFDGDSVGYVPELSEMGLTFEIMQCGRYSKIVVSGKIE